MIRTLHSFPLKPLVIALAAAQSLTSLAHAIPTQTEQVVDASYSYTTTLSPTTDILTFTPDANFSISSIAVNNQQHTQRVDNQGILNSIYSSTLMNQGIIDTLRNSGQLTIGSNSGMVLSGGAIYNTNNATITNLINSGTISTNGTSMPMPGMGAAGIQNNGIITTLTNQALGTISSTNTAIFNSGTITELNNEGTIRQLGNSNIYIGTAITNYGTLTTLNNSGTIIGNVTSYSMTDLVINGGNIRRGILTGITSDSIILPNSTLGTLGSYNANLAFQQGKLWLNDNVGLGSNGTLTNSADVLITQPVNINGNYHQTAAAVLNIGVTDFTNANGSTLDVGYGRLNVNGNAQIDPGSSIRLTSTGSSYGFASGQRYVVINATTADYNAAMLHYSADTFNGTVTGAAISDEVNNTNNLVVYLSGGNNSGGGNNNGGGNTPKPGKPLPTTGNAISSLNGLSSYSGISSPALLNLFNASKTITTEAEANRIGEQLSPGQNSMASAATSAASMDALGVVGTHLDGLRITPGASARGIATGDDSLDWAAWGKPFYGSARQGMVDNVSGYRAHYGGLVLGADRQILDSWRAGAALSYSRTSVKGQDNVKGSSSDVDAWGGILYATYSGEPWFVNLSTSLTRQSYDSQRQVAFDGFNDNASAHFTGQQVALKSEVGYPLALGANTTLTPLASLSYSYLHQGSYQENSDNGSALDVDSAHSQSVESSLGGKLAHSWSTPAGDLSPFVQVMWTHQYDRSPMTTNSGFSADSLGETRFTSQGARQAADSADTSVGVSLAHADDLTLEARYDLQTAPQFMGQTVSLQVRKLF
ncbi:MULTISPECIES: autotransporter family protein [Erwinia]|uniref:autotransporter family protein n=1 Tax=Erwinia TaxID=551 RepID=UPI0013312F43|nr:MULTISPECIES: autotransporter domain-containing protein [Erwinia]MBP2154913.1 outer membrane autotransporter protein [Erwinia rhapontici]NKG32973.1 autotransporter domain-containing protein [Erwinia rhapontici]NNS08485.1 autotransporter domain-containing protein [Erwinia sp. JH02]